MKTENELLENNQKGNEEKHKKNIDLLKKKTEEKTILQERLQNYANKIKDL
jgi:hypothetical protein